MFSLWCVTKNYNLFYCDTPWTFFCYLLPKRHIKKVINLLRPFHAIKDLKLDDLSQKKKDPLWPNLIGPILFSPCLDINTNIEFRNIYLYTRFVYHKGIKSKIWWTITFSRGFERTKRRQENREPSRKSFFHQNLLLSRIIHKSSI